MQEAISPEVALSRFESELLHKIQFKTFSNVSLDAYLFKNFKFFDLHSQGFLNRDDFFRAITKCGVVVETHDRNTIYKAYSENDGNVHYKKFIEDLLFKDPQPVANSRRSQAINEPQEQDRRLQVSRKDQPKASLQQSRIDKLYTKCETYPEVLSFIRKSIQGESVGSVLNVAVKFKTADPQRTHFLTKSAIQTQLPFLGSEDIELIFRELSENGQSIDYSILIYDLKGQPEGGRLQQIQHIFDLLDDRREGEFPINYLLSRYLSKREGTAFAKAVDSYSRFQGIDDGVFTQDDFIDFMGFLSADCPSDDQFRRLLIRPFTQEDTISVVSQRSNRQREFSVREGSQAEQKNFRKNKEQPLEQKHFNQQQNFNEFPEEKHQDDKRSVSKRSEPRQVASEKVRQVESIILRMKKRLASKGTKGFLFFEKAMKGADANRDGFLSFDEFKGVIRQQRIDITPTESNHIFNVFDEQGLDMINFSELMFALRGHIPENRKELTQKLCEQVCREGESTSFGMLKKRLNFRNHPDVQNSRKYQEDIWKEMQETILTIQQLNGTTRKDTITKAEFQEYVEQLSLSIIDDKLFETILYHFWRLENSVNITQKYAGSRKVFDPLKKGYLMDHHRYAVQGGTVSQNAPFGTSVEPTAYLTEHRKL